MKQCIACGMPMKNPEDFAMGDTRKDYCRYCCRPDGTMQSYEEKLISLTNFIVKTQGLEESAASSAAKSMMVKLPAWKTEFSISNN
ncbi:MAG: putative zinc ribbon domain containing protein [Firmicutes bacterium]|nr:putative zinc ribbon domain containing protein [Bacillota bacterium]